MTSKLNIKRALQDAVSKFRSQDEFGSNGAKGLAPEMGLSAGSLSHKVSPTYPGAHCSPEEVVEICKKTGDIGPMQAMCAELVDAGYAPELYLVLLFSPLTTQEVSQVYRWAQQDYIPATVGMPVQ